ncbi:uncharacterized protein HMPREF1541_01244 [Cyphellophora europaea CBS 101466]|uniref:CSC1/OSCA1-like 7TM region domain-containing protein n=1 Tax=Cyphellophora europaea (strain CBS 101466) TaxID=1220924 RepID=W2SGP3_CYPE1|nr:uncharacterized protein HMPREF1541_01244 [Cyphellophora europaea CBS 101466]ETN47054.1 hypothetical protein HMPREF1541_01244 [Cyphellophora europaea CBS 101466]
MALFRRQDEDTGDKLLELASDPFKTEIQSSSIITAFALYLGLALGLAILFSVFRPRHRVLFAPKSKYADEKHAPPAMGNGLFSWIKPVTTAKEPYLMDRIGLDAVVFLRFQRMLRNMFLVFGVVGIAIMLPVNVTETKKSTLAEWHIGALIYMTPRFTQGGALWAQVVISYIGNIIVAYFLWHNYRRIHSLRRSYFQTPEYQKSLHARTLIVRDLSSDLRNEDGVTRVTDHANPTGVQPKVTVGRNVKDLPGLIEDHEEQVRELESVLAKYLKNPNKLPAKRPTMKPSSKSRYSGPVTDGKVDAIDYLAERIRELETEITEVRESIDRRDPMPFAFASWDHIAQAHSVAFASRNKQSMGARIDLAPRPTDLIWKNLPMSKSTRKTRRLMNAVWISVLTLIWLPMNMGIALFLSNLGNLATIWPSFRESFEASPGFYGILQAVLAPTITSLVYMVLPIIFRRLQIRAGDVTKTEREQHVLRNLYTFFTLNNLVLFSIFAAVWQYVANIIDADDGTKSTWDAVLEGKFFLTVTQSLCDISPFWVTFLLQRNLGAAIDLTQLSRLATMWFQRRFMAPTPRQNIEWTAPVSFDYASYYNNALFFATISLAFANLQPIILLVAALFFAFDALIRKYLLMYCFVTKNESGGQMWRTLFNRMVFATMLSNVVIAALLIARDEYVMAGTLGPALLLMIGFKVYCAKTFDKEIKYYATSGLVDQESLQADGGKRRKAEKISSKFGHPALFKPLMTPMVNAKAQPILSEIYKGRLGSDAGGPLAAGFSDTFAMQPMGPSKNDGTFEFVTDAQQDFAFYKNREDFRDEAGSNLYGKPDDTMTERSATPMGFKRSGTAQYSEFSAESSRANSPAPLQRNPSQVHPAFRNGYDVDSQHSLRRMESPDSHDISLRPRSGLYTDPDDDRSNLLNHDVTMSQFRSPGGTPDQQGGYDYFRKS